MKFIIKYVPNLITTSRIIMSIIFVYTIIGQVVFGKERDMILVITFTYICISDLLDGKIARKTNSVSVIGARFDIFADLLYVILSYVTLVDIKILPPWYLGFVCFKFTEFMLTSKYIKNNKFLDKPFVFDRVGRMVSATFLIIPGIVCIYKYIGSYNAAIIINCITYITFMAGVYSSYLRIKICVTTKLNEENYIDD